MGEMRASRWEQTGSGREPRRSAGRSALRVARLSKVDQSQEEGEALGPWLPPSSVAPHLWVFYGHTVRESCPGKHSFPVKFCGGKVLSQSLK